jgi:hypothetical protein
MPYRDCDNFCIEEEDDEEGEGKLSRPFHVSSAPPWPRLLLYRREGFVTRTLRI